MGMPISECTGYSTAFTLAHETHMRYKLFMVLEPFESSLLIAPAFVMDLIDCRVTFFS
jgi:hypothetical protein